MLVSLVLRSSRDRHVGIINDRGFCCMMWTEHFLEISWFVPHCLCGRGEGLRKTAKLVTWQSVACYEEVKEIKFRAGLHHHFFETVPVRVKVVEVGLHLFLILTFGFRWVVIFTLRPLYLRETIAVHNELRLSWLQSAFKLLEKKICCLTRNLISGLAVL